MEQRIFLSVKAFGITHTAELPDYAQAIEFIEACAKLAESVGYAPTKVIEGLKKAMEARE